MTQTSKPPVLNDDAVLMILVFAGAEGALAEYTQAGTGGRERLKVVRDELVERGLIEVEDNEFYPTIEAIDAAMEAETEKLRAAAIARRSN